jgi:hypothetical protein
MKRATTVVMMLALVPGCSGDAPEQEAAVESTAASPSVAIVPVTTPTAPAPTPSPQSPPAPQVDPAIASTAHRYTEMFYDGKLDLLHEEFSEEMQDIVPMEQLNAMFEHAVTNYGEEAGVIAEESQTRGDYRGFVRWARFDKTDEVIEVQWILKPNDEIAGFYIRPAKRKVQEEATVDIEP